MKLSIIHTGKYIAFSAAFLGYLLPAFAQSAYNNSIASNRLKASALSILAGHGPVRHNEDAPETGNTALLKEFRAQKSPDGIKLTWAAAKAVASKSFEVERSVGGASFIKIGSLGSSGKNNYLFVDKYIFQPAYYYRIKIITPNGSALYSHALLVGSPAKNTITPQVEAKHKPAPEKISLPAVEKMTGTIKVLLEPNPARKLNPPAIIRFADKLDFEVTSSSREPIRVQLSGLQGRINLHREFESSAGKSTFSIEELDVLPAGNYTIVIRSGITETRLQAIK